MSHSANALVEQLSRRTLSLPRTAAVLLNTNARKVNDRVLRALARVVPEADLFVSSSSEEASQIADLVLARRYQTVFSGGGDGTFVSWVNEIVGRAEMRRAPAPRFGVLALGTGNAVAEVVGARRNGHVHHLREFLAGRTERTRQLDLVTCEGRRTPFAGIGIDAAILNDYRWLKNRLEGGPLRHLVSGLHGYGVAIALRSIPRQLAQRRPAYCEIVNTGRVAFRLDAQGRATGDPIGRGELLYAGPCMMAAASTVPFYGFGLRLFPFASSRPGMMQLRVAARVPVSSLLFHISQVWHGRFSHPGLHDFHAESVQVHVERPAPLQLGGDAEGWREQVSFGMARPVDLVDFRQPMLN